MRSGRKVRRKKKNRSMKILLVVLAVLVVGGGAASFALLGGGYSDWPEIKDPKTNPLTGEIVTELPVWQGLSPESQRLILSMSFR